MRRTVMLAVAVVAVAALAQAPATAGDATTYRYVARDFHTVYVGPDATTPVGGLAPQGIFRFVPEGTSVTITLDDHATTVGTIAVDVAASDGSGNQRLCLPAGTPTAVTGLKPGLAQWVTVWTPTVSSACDGGGTVGVATVTQA